MSPLEQANLDEGVAIRDGDLAAFTRATTREFNSAPNSDLTKSSLAVTLLAARQPRRALEILRGMQPDRGILLGDANYWLYSAYAHAQQGQLKEALTAAREGDKRVPGSSSMRTEAAVFAMLGDTAGASDALRRISSRFAWGVPRFAASSAALLANSDRPDAEAMSKRFAEGWLGHGAANGILAFSIGRLGLLAITERWSPMLALADSLRALKDMDTLNVSARLRIDAARALRTRDSDIATQRLRSIVRLQPSAIDAGCRALCLSTARALPRTSATRRVRSSCSTTQFSTRFSSTPKASVQSGAIHICSLFDNTHRFARY
jgi:hypothetical protein